MWNDSQFGYFLNSSTPIRSSQRLAHWNQPVRALMAFTCICLLHCVHCELRGTANATINVFWTLSIRSQSILQSKYLNFLLNIRFILLFVGNIKIFYMCPDGNLSQDVPRAGGCNWLVRNILCLHRSCLHCITSCDENIAWN